MISILPYQQKLEALREYMDAKIDGTGKFVIINIEAIPYARTWDEFVRIYNETGITMWSSDTEYETKITTIPFEEWYETKTQTLKTNTA